MGTCFQGVQLFVGHVGVTAVAQYSRRCLLRRTVGEPAARASRSRSSGSLSYSDWASLTIRAGCSRMLPSEFSCTRKRWLLCPGRTTLLRDSVSTVCIHSSYPRSHLGMTGRFGPFVET